ncbi:isoprenoid biosynthesis glyoxalase ElbB [bacterium]|nr:isoprenoid biosynthesis glyoxalase ElbB [bacterium]
MPKVGLILSGCGFLDGTEINEAILTILALDKANAEIVAMAPNINQHHVVDHTKGEETKEIRNVLVEAARLVRGKITDLENVNPKELDALIIPGGYGVAKNFCSFAFEGADCFYNESIAKMVLSVHNQKKPVGAICIAPALLAKIFENLKQVTLTIGTDKETAEILTSLNAKHVSCLETEIVVDKKNKIVTTPAYNIPNVRIGNVEKGISKLVETVLAMTN